MQVLLHKFELVKRENFVDGACRMIEMDLGDILREAEKVFGEGWLQYNQEAGKYLAEGAFVMKRPNGESS